MTEQEREMLRVKAEALQAIAQNLRYTPACRRAARLLAELMLALLPKRQPA